MHFLILEWSVYIGTELKHWIEFVHNNINKTKGEILLMLKHEKMQKLRCKNNKKGISESADDGCLKKFIIVQTN